MSTSNICKIDFTMAERRHYLNLIRVAWNEHSEENPINIYNMLEPHAKSNHSIPQYNMGQFCLAHVMKHHLERSTKSKQDLLN